MGLEARIWAMRMGFGSGDWNFGLKTGRGMDGRTEEEKIPHTCEIIGH